MRRLRRRVSPSVPPTQPSFRRELPLPVGWSRDAVFDLLKTISIEGAPPSELDGYLREDFERFVLTWGLVKDQRGKLLEIGANPYFTTVLIREFTDLDLTMTNCFAPDAVGVASQNVAYASSADGVVRDHVFEYHLQNVENDPLPYQSNSFDVVVFCEVIEHLLMDPVFALREIHRVLKPGGCLVVSTPNVARFENVARLVAGANMYDPYSGYGPYGRHNREYTRHELVKLLQFAGFEAETHFTADVHASHGDLFVDVSTVIPLVEHRWADLGQYLFCRAHKSADTRAGWPSELFRSRADADLVSWDSE